VSKGSENCPFHLTHSANRLSVFIATAATREVKGYDFLSADIRRDNCKKSRTEQTCTGAQLWLCLRQRY